MEEPVEEAPAAGVETEADISGTIPSESEQPADSINEPANTINEASSNSTVVIEDTPGIPIIPIVISALILLSAFIALRIVKNKNKQK